MGIWSRMDDMTDSEADCPRLQVGDRDMRKPGQRVTRLRKRLSASMAMADYAEDL